MKKVVLIMCMLNVMIVFSQEEILSYNTHIKVEVSGDIYIEEQITVRAQGISIRRGIFRTFPTKYKDRYGNRYKVDFVVNDVLRDSIPEAYNIKNQSNGKIIYIGDENTFLDRGIYTYTIKYKTNRQIGFFKDYDELYFNAIGGDWSFKILNSKITIELPEEAEIKNFVAFSGYSGSTGCDCELQSGRNRAIVALKNGLNPYEQFTFAVSWQKGVVTEPSTMEKLRYLLKDNFGILIGLVGLFVVFFTHYFKWKKVGVDPPKGTIIPLFEPPSEFSPADISYLHNMRYSSKTMTAAIVNLAVKGYLNIIQNKKKYTLQKSENADVTKLTPDELVLANKLLGSRSKLELSNTNHAIFTSAKSALNKILKTKITPKYLKFNYKELNKGILISVVFALIVYVSSSVLFSILFTIILITINIVFSSIIKAPTKLGRQLKDEIEGLKMYIDTAEKRQLDINEPTLTPARFERILPYAMALGVENKWGKHFDNVIKKALDGQPEYQPVWYSGNFGNKFSVNSFTNSVGSSFSSAISSSSSPPGSSSGSGGGGFSGGGGGGGGGGGW